MKIFDKLIYVFCFIAIATIYSCSDDTAALSTSYAKFSSSNFNASYSGSVNVFVEWSETEWEVSKEDGDVIASLSATSGGNKSDKDQKTTIVVGLNENTSKSTREQKLTIKNLTTGETSQTVIKQGIRNASASFSEKQKTVNYLSGTVKISVISSETEWELILGEGNLINSVIPLQGGDASKSGMTTDVENSLDGVDEALVIAGSDRRGTIYGIYELSGQMGVSPWYWWMDVPVVKRSDVCVLPGVYTDGEPAWYLPE